MWIQEWISCGGVIVAMPNRLKAFSINALYVGTSSCVKIASPRKIIQFHATRLIHLQKLSKVKPTRPQGWYENNTYCNFLEFKQYRGFCDFCKTCPPEKYLYKCLICQDDPELCEKCKNDDFRLDSCSTSHSLLSKHILDQSEEPNSDFSNSVIQSWFCLYRNGPFLHMSKLQSQH